MENALTSWITPNNQDGFLSLDRSEAQNLHFTASELIYPFKLKRLHSQVLLEVLLNRLSIETSYLNFIRQRL